MAAGLGFKTFTTGEVLTAADTNGYLMQGILVFANAAARDAAITSPQEGQFAYLKDTNVTTYYTGSAWANVDTTGMTNPMTTTGDTIYSSSGSTPARLGIGTANQVLRVNSGATAPEWATVSAIPANAYATVQTNQQTTSTSYTDLTTAGPAVTITTGTKALVIVSAYVQGTNNNNAIMSFEVSGATTIAASDDFSLGGKVAGNFSTGLDLRASRATVQTLTAGSNTFTAKYKCSATSASFEAREIIVINLA